MASTRSHSTRATRSGKSLTASSSDPLNSTSSSSVTSMEVDDVISGLTQLSKTATDFSKSGGPPPKDLGELDLDKPPLPPEPPSSFPSNLLDAVTASMDQHQHQHSEEQMDTELTLSVKDKEGDDISGSGSSSNDSSDSSDSEADSSETDEETAAKNKIVDAEDLLALEKMFMYTREMAYDERMRAVTDKLEEVRCGRANEYLAPLEQLQDEMKTKIEVTSQRREFRLENLRHKTESEALAAKQNFESERELLYDNVKADLEDKIRRLEEDRNIDFSSDFWLETNYKEGQGKGAKSGLVSKAATKSYSLDIFGEKKKKPVLISGPYIVYMLNELDIMEDWTTIRKAVAAPKKKYFDQIVAF